MRDRWTPRALTGGVEVEVILAQVAEAIGVSRARAQQIEQRALKHARAVLIDRHGEDVARDLARVEWRLPPIKGR
jgi:DNA-directed RNA polymerase sigma subunit (sigma70/sigma32)